MMKVELDGLENKMQLINQKLLLQTVKGTPSSLKV